jgi:hypothetical protein
MERWESKPQGPESRIKKAQIAENIVAAIWKAGQVPMPYQASPDVPAVVGFYCHAKELEGLKRTVAIFRKTLNDTMASLGMRIYINSFRRDKALAGAPAEFKDHQIVELVFPDGTATFVMFWPDVLWSHNFNPDPPLQVTLGGPDASSVSSAKSVNRRFGIS